MSMLYEKHIRSIHQAWAEAITFNRSLNVPVRWKRATTVSGVSKRGGSPITGRVGHVLLMDGERKGEFLCGAKIRNPLAHRLFNLGDKDVDLSKRQKVTCKKCLRKARQIN